MKLRELERERTGRIGRMECNAMEMRVFLFLYFLFFFLSGKRAARFCQELNCRVERGGEKRGLALHSFLYLIFFLR